MKTHDDGYVKYNMDWHQSPEFPVPNALITYRNRLKSLNLIGVYPDGIGFGNISQRSNNSTFIISGTQTGEINIANAACFSHVLKVNISQNSLTCSGPVAASSEALTHAAIYAANPKINSVIHVHHLTLWEKLKNKQATIPENIEYGTIAMAAAMENMVGEILTQQTQKIIVTAGHAEGIFTFGKSLDDAYATLMEFYLQLH